jgi:4-hydroxy-2-oxoheptanedioate aldolase
MSQINQRYRTWSGALVVTSLLVLSLSATAGQPADNHISAFVERLSRGERVFGVSTYDLSLENARALARADINYVYVDMEHGPMSFGLLQTFLLGMIDKAVVHETGRLQQPVTPLARLAPYGREQIQWVVKQALDVGLFGIIFPSIETQEQALTAVRAMRYPQQRGSRYLEPRGLRGSGPAAAVWFWGLSTSDYVRHADLWPLNPGGDLVAIMMIETATGLRNVDAIAVAPGVSGLYIGPSDLSNSLGVTRDDPEVEAAIQTIVDACRTHNIACGITANAANMVRRIEQGFTILGAGRAGGGLPASVDVALKAGRAVR